MKTSQHKKKRKVLTLLIIKTLLTASALAAPPPGKEPILLEDIRQVRMKQEENEGVLRIIQQPVQIQQAPFCTPIEQARSRIRELNKKEAGDATIQMDIGHESIAIESNEGTIDSSVHVQVVNSNEQSCL